MQFPEYRPRRLRRNEKLRGLIQETELSASIWSIPCLSKRCRKSAFLFHPCPTSISSPLKGS